MVVVENYLQFSSGWTFRECRAASCQVDGQWQRAQLGEIVGNFNQKVSQWETYGRNCYRSYCGNWDPGFFQDSHVLYGTQASKQKSDLPSKLRKELPTMPNQVTTVKWPVQNDSLASISYNVAVIWVGAAEPYVLWQFQLPSRYNPKIASDKKILLRETQRSHHVILCSHHFVQCSLTCTKWWNFSPWWEVKVVHVYL